MNYKYRAKLSSITTHKPRYGLSRNATFVGFGVLFLGGLIWVVSSNFIHTSPPKSSPLPKAVQALTLSATSSTSSELPSDSLPLNEYSNKQAIATIEQAAFLNQLNTPYGFATDPIHHRLIWTSSANETFMTATLDGSEITEIKSNFEEPYQMQFETPYGYKQLIYTDGKIRLKEVDTQQQTHSDVVLLVLGENELHGLGFDQALSTLYIGDQFGQPSLAIRLPTNDEPLITTPINPLNLK